MEVVPALLKKGEILGRIGDRREKRNAYNEAIKVIEGNAGRSSVELIRPLDRLGESHKDEYFDLFLGAESEDDLPDEKFLNKAETHYELALGIARSNADVAWQLHVDALLALGDFYTVTEMQSHARVLYREAWNLLSVDELRLARRRTELEAVVLLKQVLPDLNVALVHDEDGSQSMTEYDTGHIIMQFTVMRRGRLADIRLVEISPERDADIEAEVKLSLTSSLYRPRFEHGVAVDTPGRPFVTYFHTPDKLRLPSKASLFGELRPPEAHFAQIAVTTDTKFCVMCFRNRYSRASVIPYSHKE
jgi:tetratricopeptide (TPR) repeat protein